MIRTYYLLTKPGIIVGNLITTVSGFALASRGQFDVFLFLSVLFGLGCVIASSCVCNNYIDRTNDQKMERTKNRALARGLISGKSALIYAAILGGLGMIVLSIYTNWLVVGLAALGFFIYVGLYSFWKYSTSYATLVGSISGALPPVIGYCAVSHTVDAGAVCLFAILVLWQMPHFFAIAIYRFADYTAAAIPILPIQKGPYAAKMHMMLYILAFLATAPLLIVFSNAGVAYLAVATVLGILWLWLCILGFKAGDDRVWARRMFLFSLIVIIGISIMLSFDTGHPVTIS